MEKPADFWGKIAAQFHWQTPPAADKFLEYNFDVNKVRKEWRYLELNKSTFNHDSYFRARST